MSDYIDWVDVKAKAAAADSRTPEERAAGRRAARERTEAYIRDCKLAEKHGGMGPGRTDL